MGDHLVVEKRRPPALSEKRETVLVIKRVL